MVDIDQFILQWKGTVLGKTKINLSKKNKVRGITLSDIKAYYIATEIDFVVLGKGQKHRLMEQN